MRCLAPLLLALLLGPTAAQDEVLAIESIVLYNSTGTGFTPFATFGVTLTGCGCSTARNNLAKEIEIELNGVVWLRLPADGAQPTCECLPASVVGAPSTAVVVRSVADGAVLHNATTAYERGGLYSATVANETATLLQRQWPRVRLAFTTPALPPVDRNWTATVETANTTFAYVVPALPDASADLPFDTAVRVEAFWTAAAEPAPADDPLPGPRPEYELQPYFTSAAPLDIDVGTVVRVRGRFLADRPHWCHLLCATGPQFLTEPARTDAAGTHFECVMPAGLRTAYLIPKALMVVVWTVGYTAPDGGNRTAGIGAKDWVVLRWMPAGPAPPPAGGFPAGAAVAIVAGSLLAVGGAVGAVLFVRRRRLRDSEGIALLR